MGGLPMCACVCVRVCGGGGLLGSPRNRRGHEDRDMLPAHATLSHP